MAAGQQKKRLISSNLHEQCRGKKKKKTDTSDYVLNLRSQIYLEWNDSQKKAMAKREQIVLTWADMAPFVEFVPRRHSGLVDVLCVPRETYSLSNLMGVLSHEVWATSLSESERKLLTQFLPSGTGAEQTVQLLLSGENHHFGNPLLKWSTLLCSGNLHPDGTLQRQRKIRSDKKQYYVELNKYHSNMLEELKKWKNKWIHCDNPEQLWRKELINSKETTLPVSSEKVEDTPQEICVRNDDMEKYMSYIKINKKQLKAVKSLKHSRGGIQSKTLSCVLGDINSFPTHPYEALEKEERTKLREHWLQIVRRDLPLTLKTWNEKRLHREQLMKYLGQELSEKRTLMIHKAVAENPDISLHEKIEDDESKDDNELVEQDVVSASISSNHDNNLEYIASCNSHKEQTPEALDEEAVGQDTLVSGDNPSVLSQLNGKDLTEVVKPNASISLVKGTWQAVDATRYPSSEFCLTKPELIEERLASPVIDLERNIEHEGQESGDASLFSLYASQRRGDLPSFVKGPEIFSYPSSVHLHELKQPELQFLMANGGLSETLQFPNQIQTQQNLNEPNHARVRDHLYVHQELYSSSNGGDIIGHNWFPNDHHAHNNYWSGIAPPISGPHRLGDVGTSDGSLFSVLSACRNGPSQSQQNAANAEQPMEARNFFRGQDMYGYASHQLKSSSNNEAVAASSAALHDQWIDYQPHQNPSLQDSIGKPFVRSWNQ